MMTTHRKTKDLHHHSLRVALLLVQFCLSVSSAIEDCDTNSSCIVTSAPSFIQRQSLRERGKLNLGTESTETFDFQKHRFGVPCENTDRGMAFETANVHLNSMGSLAQVGAEPQNLFGPEETMVDTADFFFTYRV